MAETAQASSCTDGDLVLLVSTDSPTEAILLQNLLAQVEIVSFVCDQYMAQAYFVLLPALQGVRLLVARRDLALARQVLAQFAAGDFDTDPEPQAQLRAAPALWDPGLAILWGFFLTPAFAATLYWINSLALPEPALRRQAESFLVVAWLLSIGLYLPAIFLTENMFGPWLVTISLAEGIKLILPLFVYQQSRYICREYGGKFPKREWTTPVLLALAFLILPSFFMRMVLANAEM
mgnify:CR=1 FL=1